MGIEQEQIVRDFLSHARGEQRDVDALVDRMANDFTLQVNVPTSRPVVGRGPAYFVLERQNEVASGFLPGSTILNIASTNRTVFVERIDVVAIGVKRLTVHVTGVFEVSGGKIVAWRDYYDSVDLAKQMGVHPDVVVEARP